MTDYSMEKLLKNYAKKNHAKPALDRKGNLMMDHEDRFIEISWNEFFRKLKKKNSSIVVASENSSALA